MTIIFLVGLGIINIPKAYFTTNFNGNIRPCCPGVPGGLTRCAYILQNKEGLKVDIGNYLTGIVEYDTVFLKILDEAGYDVLGIGDRESNLLTEIKKLHLKTPMVFVDCKIVPSFFIKTFKDKKILYTSTHTVLADSFFENKAEYYIVSTTDRSLLKRLKKFRKDNLFIVAPFESLETVSDHIVPVKTGYITMLDLADGTFEYLPIKHEGPEHSRLARMADEILSQGKRPALALEIFYKKETPAVLDSITSLLSPIYNLQIIKHDIATEGETVLSRISRSFGVPQKVPLIYISRYNMVIENNQFSKFLEFIKKPQTITVIIPEGCKNCGRIKYLLSSIKKEFPLLTIEWVEKKTADTVVIIADNEYPVAGISHEKLAKIIAKEIWKALQNF